MALLIQNVKEWKSLTIDELIQALKETGLPGNTEVYLANDDDRTFRETDEVLKVRVGTLENPRTVVAIY